jgi:hypothetical protein
MPKILPDPRPVRQPAPTRGEQSARELGADDGSLTPTEIAGHLREIATAGAARRDALALAAAYDRLARKAPRRRRPDLALCYEHQDTTRLLAALGDAWTRVQAVRFLGRLRPWIRCWACSMIPSPPTKPSARWAESATPGRWPR